MNILFLGDVFGKPGRNLVIERLPQFLETHKIDFCVVNGENLADGRGLTERTCKPLFHAGVDIVTGGNHLWDRNESLDFIHKTPQIVKPLNYPFRTPGSRWFTLEKKNVALTVVSLAGQIYMPPTDSPFLAIDKYYDDIRANSNIILVDFHAESTAEKRAMGWFLDGRVSALIGTHTHIQTADEEILPRGMAYLTDAGMTGPHDSVIGIRKNIILEKMLTAVPIRYEVPDTGLQLNGAIIKIDVLTGKALSITRVKQHCEAVN
ncbi:MAG: TIGR00282 family metallophosphoesterase [Candidatus Cloacimonetes bacterium HGW-Cloacimonetes-1]|jgi:hypothetical protein|nr:MAG: TIGR00282 family metallophosphoesterase [Candidatus Cloacimonetes bacterium HGW-Cloacimonetes-1]